MFRPSEELQGERLIGGLEVVKSRADMTKVVRASPAPTEKPGHGNADAQKHEARIGERLLAPEHGNQKDRRKGEKPWDLANGLERRSPHPVNPAASWQNC